MSERCDGCDRGCGVGEPRPDESQQQEEMRRRIMERLCDIRHKVVVLSGKGGVGKSTVAVNLAVALARQHRVGLMDVDIHGPNVPKMLGIEGQTLGVEKESIIPFQWGDNLKVMSIAFLLQGRDSAVIWRGPLKMIAIRQFITDVEWGKLDWLVIDAPPGTGDEPLSVLQLIEDLDGCIIVTTPQEVALLDVAKCVTFCEKVGRRILGLVENMTHLVCPHCGKKVELYPSGDVERFAGQRGLKVLGSVPFEPRIARLSDEGKPVVVAAPETDTAKAFLALADKVCSLLED